jgi:lipopolysaccharide cholinephosphotransferase
MVIGEFIEIIDNYIGAALFMTNDYGNLELHKVLLSAMKGIDKICQGHSLRYSLYAGTLLGTVNLGGFIP